MDFVVAAAQTLGVNLDNKQQSQFKRYRELIELRNKQFNLTGLKTWEKIREELFIRSLRVLAPAGGNVQTREWFEGKQAIDVGTGAGIPGIILKIAVPELQITLFDSNKKRTNFLTEVVNTLELNDIQVVNGRAEAPP